MAAARKTKAQVTAKAKAKPAPRRRVKLYAKQRGAGDAEVFVLEQDGARIVTQLSGVFSSGKAQTKTLATVEKATARYDELLAEKRAAGYRALGEIDGPRVPVPRNEALEAALREDPADAAPYLVYADWLQTQGSPAGEMLVLAQGDKAQQKRALAMAKQLGLPRKELATFGWRHGVWQWLRLHNDVDWMDGQWDPMPMVRTLFASPLCAALEELRVGILRWEYSDQPDVIRAAGKHAWARDLRRLHLGDVGPDIDMDHHAIGNVGPLIGKTFPRLTSLVLHSGGESMDTGESLNIGGLDLPDLTSLTIETCAMSAKRLRSLTAAAQPKLEHLELWFGARDRGATAKIADVVPVFDLARYPRLRRLALRNSELTTDIVRMLPASKLAAQLETLDLTMGTMTDDDARELAAEAGAFKALRELHVGDAYVHAAGLKTLRAAFPGATVTNKAPKEIEEDDPTWRYVSVHE